MNALSSLQASVTAFHESDYGMGEAIVFTHLSSGSTENTFGVVESNKYNQQEDVGQETKNVRSNNVIFANVKLDVEPEIDDTALCRGTTYDVADFIIESTGLYTIMGVANARHSGRPNRHRV